MAGPQTWKRLKEIAEKMVGGTALVWLWGGGLVADVALRKMRWNGISYFADWKPVLKIERAAPRQPG